MGNQNLIQSLEPRRLLAASFASLSSQGTLSIIGTAKNDTITISLTNGKIVAKLNSASMSFAKSSVKRIWADGFGGNDRITNHAGLPSTLRGGPGDDSLTGGSNVDDILPGTGANTIDGGSGHDILDYSDLPASSFTIDNDPNYLPLADQGIRIQRDDLDYWDVLLHCHGDELLGTPGNDYFSGALYSPIDMTIAGGDGNDEMPLFNDNSFDGIDARITLDGGNGNDDFATGDSFLIPDKIIGGNGNDFFEDDVFMTSDPNAVDLGAGFDRITEDNTPLDQTLTLYCGPGVESLDVGEDGRYKIVGNDLDNEIYCNSSFGGSTIIGGGGDDQLYVDSAPAGDPLSRPPNLILGGPGNDLLVSSTSIKSILNGQDGNDTLVSGYVGAGDDDVLIGGRGNDTADFSKASGNLRITLDNKANDGGDFDQMNVESDIETIIGGSGNDYIQGSNAANKLLGNAGDDTLLGGDGNDTLWGGRGRDKLYGETGNDILYAKDGQRDMLDGGDGFDKASSDKSATIKDQVLNIEKFI